MGRVILGRISAVFRRILFIGFSFQIFLGIYWMSLNFRHMVNYGETNILLGLAENLTPDEYEGILYPLLIRGALWFQNLSGVSYYYLLYGLALLCSLLSAFWAVSSILDLKGIRRIWTCLVVVTLPFAAQTQLAVLSNSLCCSAMLAMCGFAAAYIKDEERQPGNIVWVGAFWVLADLLRPEMLLVGAVVLPFMLIIDRADKRKIMIRAAFMVSLTIALILVNSLIETPGALGRPQRNIYGSLASRLGWTDLFSCSEDWTPETKEAVEGIDIYSVMYSPQNMDEFRIELENRLSEDELDAVYKDIIRTAWKRGYMRNLRIMLYDVAGYVISPVDVQLEMDSWGFETASGQNYMLFRQNTPLISKYYGEVCGWFFAIALLLWPILLIAAAVGRNWELVGPSLMRTVPAVLVAIVMTVYYTLRGAGIMDYKNTVFITIIEVFLILNAGFAKLEERRSGRGY